MYVIRKKKFYQKNLKKVFVSGPRPGEVFFLSEPPGNLKIYMTSYNAMLSMISTSFVFVLTFLTYI